MAEKNKPDNTKRVSNRTMTEEEVMAVSDVAQLRAESYKTAPYYSGRPDLNHLSKDQIAAIEFKSITGYDKVPASQGGASAGAPQFMISDVIHEAQVFEAVQQLRHKEGRSLKSERPANHEFDALLAAGPKAKGPEAEPAPEPIPPVVPKERTGPILK